MVDASEIAESLVRLGGLDLSEWAPTLGRRVHWFPCFLVEEGIASACGVDSHDRYAGATGENVAASHPDWEKFLCPLCLAVWATEQTGG